MKILVTSTDSMMIQFLMPHVKNLIQEGHQVDIACSVVKGRMEEIKAVLPENVNIYTVNLARSPLKLSNFKGLKQLKGIIANGDYDLIWTNEPVMGVMTRLAAKKHRKKGLKVLYMAHGFHFFKGAPKKNWMIFYPIEKFMARYTDVLVTITKEDYEFAQRKFHTVVKHIHGIGVNAQKYLSVRQEENEKFLKEQNYVNRYVILCTGELNRNKNQITVIKAIQQVVMVHPEVLLLFAGIGDSKKELENYVLENSLEKNVSFLGYRNDLEKFVNACNLSVSASYREGLPLNIMEAMLCSKPVIASNNRGHRELIIDGESGYILEPDDIQAFSKKIIYLIENESVVESFVCKAKKYIANFTIDNVKMELEEILKIANN